MPQMRIWMLIWLWRRSDSIIIAYPRIERNKIFILLRSMRLRAGSLQYDTFFPLSFAGRWLYPTFATYALVGAKI